MATLPETVESVRNQDYADVEHIFVDGGSTDGTLEYISKERPASTVLTNVGGGISRAMNAGIAAATGDIVAHLHSDDFYKHGGVLSRVAQLFEATGRDWIVGRTDDLRNGKIEPGASVLPFSRWRFLSRGAYLPHPSTFMRIELMRRLGGFDETVRYAMDIDCWIRALRISQTVARRRAVGGFSRTHGSLSSTNQVATIKDEWRVRRRYVGDAITAMPLMHCRMFKHVLFT